MIPTIANIPLTQTITRFAWRKGTTDGHGNALQLWDTEGHEVHAIWYVPDSSTESEQGNRVRIDAVAFIPESVAPHPKDRWDVGGVRYEQIAAPGDYNHGPWWRPGLLVLTLRRVEDLD